MVRTNFVLIDFENVQPKDMALMLDGPFKVKIFLGSLQTKIPVALVTALQPFGSEVEYIRVEGNGSNALDFHIAFYIGRLAAEFPDAFFHIISNDSGFDPLIKHLKAQKIFSARSSTIADIPLFKSTSPASSTEERVDSVITKLTGQKASKPKNLKSLKATIRNYFASKLADDELQHILHGLTRRGIVVINEDGVAYRLPG